MSGKDKGMSMIEILVVILVFAILATLATESLLLSLRGTRRSESSIGVRENLNQVLSIMERALHNAESVSCPNSTTINYIDSALQSANFTCDTTGGFVASSSAQLTSPAIRVTQCTFSCTVSGAGIPDSVSISLSAQDSTASGLEQQVVTTNTEINLRTY